MRVLSVVLPLRQIREGALSDQRGTRVGALIGRDDEPQIKGETAQPISLFQLVARGDPPRGDDVRVLPAVAAH